MMAIEIMVIRKNSIGNDNFKNICFGMADLIPDNTKRTSMTSI